MHGFRRADKQAPSLGEQLRKFAEYLPLHLPGKIDGHVPVQDDIGHLHPLGIGCFQKVHHLEANLLPDYVVDLKPA